MTRLSDPQGAGMYDQRDERGQRQRDADQDAYEARTEGRATSRDGRPERRRTPPRPYAKQRTYPSVTTVIGVMDKPGLAWGASKECAMYAVHQRDQWEHLPDDEAVDKLRKHHDVIWKSRAGIGTLLHSVNEAWSWDEDADLPDLIATMDRRPKLWADDAVAIAEVQPYVDGLEKFWNDWTPDTIGTEEVVRNPDKQVGYIGQCDWRCVMDGAVWRLDLKSTGKSEGDIKPYTDSWRPQICAYDRAPEIVYYTAEGVEDGTAPNERAERYGVVHLRGDGDYNLIEIAADDEAYDAFMAMRRVYDWTKAHGRPTPKFLTPPVREAVA